MDLESGDETIAIIVYMYAQCHECMYYWIYMHIHVHVHMHMYMYMSILIHT